MLVILDFITGKVHVYTNVLQETVEEFIEEWEHGSIEWMYHKDMEIDIKKY